MTDEQIKAKAREFFENQGFGSTVVIHFNDAVDVAAEYAQKVASEQTADLREQVKALIEADQHVAERIGWILGACEIDRDAKHELEGILYGIQEAKDE